MAVEVNPGLKLNGPAGRFSLYGHRAAETTGDGYFLRARLSLRTRAQEREDYGGN
jgi:hypothetical protein